LKLKYVTEDVAEKQRRSMKQFITQKAFGFVQSFLIFYRNNGGYIVALLFSPDPVRSYAWLKSFRLKCNSKSSSGLTNAYSVGTKAMIITVVKVFSLTCKTK
jgi:hypothetical protein